MRGGPIHQSGLLLKTTQVYQGICREEMVGTIARVAHRQFGQRTLRASGARAAPRLQRLHSTQTVSAERPQNVGIVALDVYFPQRCVEQKDLEVADGVAEGKYRIGLGQERMAYVGDREDINSIIMSACSNLLSKYNISPDQVGRVEVGTETIVDKSKSTKTYLMELLGSNTDVEGVTCINACYGGTAAILNSVAWVESAAWDGRYAIVVAGDIAVYAPGPARPTGGCGAVAMLIGPDAALPLGSARHSHAEHCWDFYKPEMHSEYPAVDGHLSNTVYLRSVDVCYSKLLHKAGLSQGVDSFDYMCFHSPYNKLVVKSVGRLLYNDFVANPAGCDPGLAEALAQWHPDSVTPASTYADRGLDAALKKVSAPVYKAKCSPSALLSKELGNSYTGALWVNLTSLVDQIVRARGSGALRSSPSPPRARRLTHATHGRSLFGPFPPIPGGRGARREVASRESVYSCSHTALGPSPRPSLSSRGHPPPRPALPSTPSRRPWTCSRGLPRGRSPPRRSSRPRSS